MIGFLNSVTVPKNVNGDLLEFLPLLAKYRKQMKGDPLLQSKKFTKSQWRKKSK